MDDATFSSPADLALLDLLRRLDGEGYEFVTPTPLTQARVVARRRGQLGRGLRDILGWSLPFAQADAPPQLVASLEAAGVLTQAGSHLKSAIRVSRLHGRLYIHSAFPTDAEDAVFLGPDSYRFADFVARELEPATTGRMVDVGGGCGVGALVAAALAPDAELLLTDINPLALRYARLNARHADVALATLLTDGLQDAPDELGAVIANPPYMAASAQTYRDGGGPRGAKLSLDWARAALGKLSPGGRMLLYTGAAIADGHDALHAALATLAETEGAALAYRELDPDVFGEELERDAYADVERIAVVGAILTRP
ncbi:MAG: methyltransferase [Phenylobacterium sp.]|nr:MAG: methyltransferase [Phenylobacterium sp.]